MLAGPRRGAAANPMHLALLLVCSPLLAALAVAVQDPAPTARPTAPAAAKPAPPQWPAAALQRLTWLSGTWTIRNGKRTTEEHWRPLQGTTLLGCSHTFSDSKTHFFEHLRITAMHGTIAYLAMPGGTPPTSFLLTRLEDGVAVFENAEHDHPQRIRYERTAVGLTATISQLDDSRATRFVFTREADK